MIIESGVASIQQRRSSGEKRALCGTIRCRVESGLRLAGGKFYLQPDRRRAVFLCGIAGFTESGADSLDLDVVQQDVKRMRTTLGGGR